MLPAGESIAPGEWQKFMGFADVCTDDMLIEMTSLAQRMQAGCVTKQCKHLGHLRRLLPPLAGALVFLGEHAQRSQQICAQPFAAIIASLLGMIPEIERQISCDASADAVNNNDTVDGIPEVFKISLAPLLEEAKRVTQAICTQWKSDIDDLSLAINGWIPSGWQAHRDTLLEHQEVRAIE